MAVAVTLRKATEEYGLSRRMLYALIAEGQLQSTTVGRRRLILVKSLDKVVTQGATLKRKKAGRVTREGI